MSLRLHLSISSELYIFLGGVVSLLFLFSECLLLLSLFCARLVIGSFSYVVWLSVWLYVDSAHVCLMTSALWIFAAEIK